MKIGIIAPTTIPARRANTLQIMKMTQAFVELGHDVRLAVPDVSRNQDVGERNWINIAHHYGLSQEFLIDWLPSRTKLRRYDYAWSAVRWARGWQAEIIYTRLPQAAALAANQGLGTILEIHDFPQGFFGPRLFKRFLHGKGALRLIVISKILKKDLRDEFGPQVKQPFTKIIPDGVDLIRYADLPDPIDSRGELIPKIQGTIDKYHTQFFPDRFTAGYTGHLYPGRGINVILAIAEQFPEMNFLIVGGEPKDVDDFRRTASERRLQNVTFTGFIANAELPMYQAACDVLLMPYQRIVAASSGGDIARYLSPMKLFEYLACGRAICSSDLPVLREVLSEDIAILLPPEDIESWVIALRELRDNPMRRNDLATKAQQAAGLYSWDSRVKKILEGINL